MLKIQTVKAAGQSPASAHLTPLHTFVCILSFNFNNQKFILVENVLAVGLMCVSVSLSTTKYMCRSEDSLPELVLSFHEVGSEDGDHQATLKMI